MAVVFNSEGLAVDLPDAEAQKGLADGTHSYPMNNPQGDPVAITQSQFKGLEPGYTQPSPDQLNNLVRYGKAASESGQVKSFFQGVGRGAIPLGATDMAQVALGASPEDILANKEVNPWAAGLGELTGFVGSNFIPVVGTSNLLNRAEKTAAGLFGVGKATTVAGKLLQGAVKGGVANGLLSVNDDVDNAFLGNPASMEYAVANAGISTALGAGIGGLFSAPGAWRLYKSGPLSEQLKNIRGEADGDIIAPWLKRALSVFGGVSEKNQEAYAAARQAVNDAPELSAVRDHVIERITQINEKLSANQFTAAEAAHEYEKTHKMIVDDIMTKGRDAAQAKSEAKLVLKDALGRFSSNLTDSALNTAPDVVVSVEALRNRVTLGSAAALDVLEQEGLKPQTEMRRSALEKIRDDIQIAKETSEKGGLRISDEGDILGRFSPSSAKVGYLKSTGNSTAELMTAVDNAIAGKKLTHNQESIVKSVYGGSGYDPNWIDEASSFMFGDNIKEGVAKKITLNPMFDKAHEIISDIRRGGTESAQSTADRVAKEVDSIRHVYGNEIHLTDAKKVIQSLDRLSTYGFNATEFEKGLSPYFKQIRHVLDEELKGPIEKMSPYRKAMIAVAEDSKLLHKLDRFGELGSATRTIKGLGSPDNYKIHMPFLRQLEERVGSNFIGTLEKYANPELRLGLEKAIPEVEMARKADLIHKNLTDPAFINQVKKSTEMLPEYQKMMEAQFALELSKLEKQGISGLTAHTVEGKLNNLKRGKFGAEVSLERIPEFNGMTIKEVMRLRGVKEAFEKGATNGSRNVNLFSKIFKGLGVGGLAHMAGPAGAILGANVDVSGPKMVKGILDMYLGKLPELTEVGSHGALRNSTAKFLDHPGDVNPMAFRAMVHLADNAAKGYIETDRVIKSLFKPSTAPVKIVPPAEKDRKKIKDAVEKHTFNPTGLLDVGDSIGYYNPHHATALGQLSANAVQYLDSLRPKTHNGGVLNSSLPDSSFTTGTYNRAVDVAQNPLLVIHSMKNGMVTPQDKLTFQTIYPKLYSEAVEKITSGMIELYSKGGTLPYRTRLGISAFTGLPIDSTMSGQSILALQPQPNQGGPGQQGKKGSMKGLDKLSKSYQTNETSRESQRLSRKA